VRAAIALQESSRLLQHLLSYIANATIALHTQRFYRSVLVGAVLFRLLFFSFSFS